jgi:hypothetical protein
MLQAVMSKDNLVASKVNIKQIILSFLVDVKVNFNDRMNFIFKRIKNKFRTALAL